MAHLVDREGFLDEDEIGALWDYLRGTPAPGPVELRRPHTCVECAGYLISDTERGCDVCSECGVVQPDSQHYVDSYDDRERATGRSSEAPPCASSPSPRREQGLAIQSFDRRCLQPWQARGTRGL